MNLFILILALSAYGLFLNVAVFEFALGTLMVTPLIWFILARISPATFLSTNTWESGSYWVVLLLVCGLSYYVFGRTQSSLKERFRLERDSILVFSLSFLLALYLCLSWPDFIAMGERLRDYSVLSSTIQSPLVPLEPWMNGTTLNYYVYWYRFGHMIHAMFGAPTWQVYHLLMSFVFSTYLTVIFCFMHKVIGWNKFMASLLAAVIAMGSNVAGIVNWVSGDQNWWGPSRVVKGAINEFPAWSFLLGDLHPHFLNLFMMPFFLLLGFHLLRTSRIQPRQRTIILVFSLLCSGLWFYASNPWELPMWGGLLIALFLLVGADRLVKKASILEAINGWWKGSIDRRTVVICSFLGIVALSLFVSTRHLVPEGGHIKFVDSAIPLTTRSELLMHWGIPLLILTISTIFVLPTTTSVVIASVSLAAAMIFRDGVVLLYTLLLFQAIRLFLANKTEPLNVLPEALIIAGLGLVLLPEVIFLDDPYGGENERMNTIFKAYSSAWFMLQVGASYLLYRALSRVSKISSEIPKSFWYLGSGVTATLTVVFLGGFFVATIPLRISQAPRLEPTRRGLSEVESRFPGSASIIGDLEKLPRGVVLEAQGNAYDYTSFVSTLAGQPSYLGWSNHVNLLTKKYDEVSRREKITEEFYKESSCEKRLELAKKEGIQYVVVGELERIKIPSVKEADFTCFKKISKSGGYELFGFSS